MAALEAAGVVRRETSHGAYELASPDLTHALVQAAANLGRLIWTDRAADAQQHALDVSDRAPRRDPAPDRERRGR